MVLNDAQRRCAEKGGTYGTEKYDGGLPLRGLPFPS